MSEYGAKTGAQESKNATIRRNGTTGKGSDERKGDGQTARRKTTQTGRYSIPTGTAKKQ